MRQDEFVCADIETLLTWVLTDLKEKHEVFGFPEEIFFTPKVSDPFRMRRFGRLLETPIGVAAGPHTQMTQNIVSAYLCGARYIELKTIQVLDELEVTKPCIDMTDEGYNCEWSQELRLDESFDQYLNAFILLYILRDMFQWGEGADPGFIFNMSAGYNLEGIRSPKVQRFFDRMADCSTELEEKIARVEAIYPRVRELEIPTCLSDNLTVSTMHGCPPDEVEKIGRYFIEERGLHTTIKFNPTLLGADRVREILNDRLGYETRVPDEAFAHDLKYDDAVDLIASLRKSAEARGVQFSLKLTNTLETENVEQNLPDKEPTVYMSGRALHPISINLAARLQEAFDGALDISFAGGVNAFNLVDTLACGLRPVTVSSDLLKPGGYGRLSQYLEILGREMVERNAATLEDLSLSRSGGEDPRQAALETLKAYAK
ncbi:MAG: putative selenate reductase subunit YgfK, partial [Deltaproteobacteria bacterium]